MLVKNQSILKVLVLLVLTTSLIGCQKQMILETKSLLVTDGCGWPDDDTGKLDELLKDGWKVDSSTQVGPVSCTRDAAWSSYEIGTKTRYLLSRQVSAN